MKKNSEIDYEWDLSHDSNNKPRYPTYEEALERVKKLHYKKFGHETLTPGEFFGFRRTYEAMTGEECPPYERVG